MSRLPLLALVGLLGVAAPGCRDATPSSPPLGGAAGSDLAAADAGADSAIVDAGPGEGVGAGPDADADAHADAEAERDGARADAAAGGGAPRVVIASWNLHNFSSYGGDEFRLDEVAGTLGGLGADAIGVQEIKVAEGTDGSPPQAWDALLALLPEHGGVHAPWDLDDTTVGLVWDTRTTTLLATETLFASDWYAFPRAPLRATVEVARGGRAVSFDIIVLHLKAFGDSAERRRDACQKLRAWLDVNGSDRTVVLGDLNDDPYDPPADNVFAGTFLGVEPAWHFVTAALPPESVTSLGWHHWVDGVQIDGELIDHVILSGPLRAAYASATPTLWSVPPAERDAWRTLYSDHFPVSVELAPPGP